MANVKISELSALTTTAAADLFVVVDNSEASSEKTKYITYANFQDAILSDATELPMAIGGTDQIKLVDGVLQPVTDNDVDLGATSYQFKNIYLEGSVIQNGVNKKIWKNSPSTASSSTFSGLSGGKFYTLKYRISKTAGAIVLQFNADSGTNYLYAIRSYGESSGSNYENLSSASGGGSLTVASGIDCVGTICFYGTSGGTVTVDGSSFSYYNSDTWYKISFGGYYSGASSLSSVTLSGTSMTGEIWLEEMD